MRGGRPLGGLICFIMIVLGVLIMCAMLLPASFWWFLLGVSLIAFGVRCANRR